MEPQSYKIIFQGKVVEGVEPETARANMQRLFKADEATLEKLFSGKRMVLRKGLSEAEAEKYHGALSKAGLQFTTEPEPAADSGQNIAAPEPVAAVKENPAVQSELKPRNDSAKGDSPDPYAPPTQDVVASKQVFCRACGAGISATEKICPACGDKQLVGKSKSKVTAALLAIFLGFLGAHRFYLGQWVGLIYVIFGFLAWPVAIVEGVVFLFTGQERWQQKYGNVVTSGGLVVVIVVAFVGIAVIGILAAIAVPAYQDYVQRAKVSTVIADVQPDINSIESFILRERKYPASNAEAGLDADLPGDQIKSIVVSGRGVMTVTLGNSKAGVLNDQTLIWIPELSGATVNWDCSGGTLPARYRPAGCKGGSYSGQQSVGTSQWVTSEDGVTKMQVPKAWKQLPELTELGAIEYGHLQREQYLAVVTESKQNFASDTRIFRHTANC